jgi:hypothetical protein
MKLLALSALCFCVAVMSSCVPLDNRLLLVNKTRRSVAVETYTDTIPSYPSINHREFYLENCLLPGDSVRQLRWTREGWVRFVESSRNKSLNLVVYDCERLEKSVSIDSLIKHRIYRLLVVDRATLSKNKWKVVVE